MTSFRSILSSFGEILSSLVIHLDLFGGKLGGHAVQHAVNLLFQPKSKKKKNGRPRFFCLQREVRKTFIAFVYLIILFYSTSL